MKKIYSILLVLLLSLAGLSAQAQVVLNAQYFPDDNFRAALAEITGVAEGETLSEEILASTTQIDVHGRGIASLKGLRYFTALEKFECYSNKIKGSQMCELVRVPFVRRAEVVVFNADDENEGNECFAYLVSGVTYKRISIRQIKGGSVKNYEGAPLIFNEDNFPDANFRAYLTKKIGIAEGEVFPTGYNQEFRDIEISDKGIKSLKGIEAIMFSIEMLDCQRNQLTSLDIPSPKLVVLRCSENQLTSLDVYGCTNLSVLWSARNPLTSLDVSSCPQLYQLYTQNTQLTSLDLSKNVRLVSLSCRGNQLTSLDLSANPKLSWVDCAMNQIAGANMDALVNSLPTVEDSEIVIYSSFENDGNVCTKKQVSVAKEKGWKVMKEDADRNYSDYEGSDPTCILLSEAFFPDANFRAALTEILWISDEDGFRWISEGDEISDEMIERTTLISVPEKNIASLEGIEYFTALKVLWCYNNQLTSLDVSKNTALTELECGVNPLTSLDVSKNTELTRLICPDNGLTTLDVSKNTKLRDLRCSSNSITSLDVSKNTELSMLQCMYTPLTSLDVSKNTKLETMNCRNCQFTSLDVSNNTELKELWCEENQLTSLDVSKNTKLEDLDCSKNQLTSLDVSATTHIWLIKCYGNQIKEDAMEVLVNSLPTVESGLFTVYKYTGDDEGNVCTKSQVAKARGKGWTVQQTDEWGKRKDYDGVETGIRSLQVSGGTDKRYDLQGRRTTTSQSGITIVNGQKYLKK